MTVDAITESDADLTSPDHWGTRWQDWQRRNSSRRRIRQRTVLEGLLDLPNVDRPRVLELGCAPGTMLARMSSLRPTHEYHGLDYSASGLDVCRQSLQRLGVKATLFLADYWNFASSERYDLVVSFGVIEHARDPTAALARHASLAHPGGHVAVSVPNYSHCVAAWFAAKIDPQVFDTHNIAIMDPAVLERSLQSAGLVNVNVQASGKPKLRTTCPQRTTGQLAWRSAAKLWNASTRLLPTGSPWFTTLWATGRVPA